jgi:hypothetical protein
MFYLSDTNGTEYIEELGRGSIFYVDFKKKIMNNLMKQGDFN